MSSTHTAVAVYCNAVKLNNGSYFGTNTILVPIITGVAASTLLQESMQSKMSKKVLGPSTLAWVTATFKFVANYFVSAHSLIF
jgi:hypothetical protein